MQSCAVSSSVSLMFQKGSGVEKKYLYSGLLRKNGKKERKEGKLNAGEKSKTVSFSERSEEFISDVAAKLCLMERLQGLMDTSDKHWESLQTQLPL